jgi:hypothetical protein
VLLVSGIKVRRKRPLDAQALDRSSTTISMLFGYTG